jgi:hypothetical protein
MPETIVSSFTGIEQDTVVTDSDRKNNLEAKSVAVYSEARYLETGSINASTEDSIYNASDTAGIAVVAENKTFNSLGEAKKIAADSEALGVNSISSSEDDSFESDNKAQTRILSMLPDGFAYKMFRTIQYRDIQSFHCTFIMKVDSEETVRKWLTT